MMTVLNFRRRSRGSSLELRRAGLRPSVVVGDCVEPAVDPEACRDDDEERVAEFVLVAMAESRGRAAVLLALVKLLPGAIDSGALGTTNPPTPSPGARASDEVGPEVRSGRIGRVS